MPLVSVILLNYNNKDFINDSFMSIISQSFKDYEFIIIDDGSKDGSVELLKELQSVYKFELHLQENKGVSRTLNFGIQELAKGKYIAPLASDDYWHKDNLKEKVNFLESNPQYGMCFSNIYQIQDNKILRDLDTSYFKSGWIFEELLLGKARVQGVSSLVKRSVYLDCECYDETLIAEDWDMYLRIAYKYQIGYLPKKLMYYRYHENNSSKNYLAMHHSVCRSLSKWKNHPIYPEAIKRYNKSFLEMMSTYQKEEAFNIILNYIKKYKEIPIVAIIRYILPKYLFKKIKYFIKNINLRDFK